MIYLHVFDIPFIKGGKVLFFLHSFPWSFMLFNKLLQGKNVLLRHTWLWVLSSLPQRHMLKIIFNGKPKRVELKQTASIIWEYLFVFITFIWTAPGYCKGTYTGRENQFWFTRSCGILNSNANKSVDDKELESTKGLIDVDTAATPAQTKASLFEK